MHFNFHNFFSKSWHQQTEIRTGSGPEVKWKWTCVIGFIRFCFALRYKQKNVNSKDSLSLIQNLKSKQTLDFLQHDSVLFFLETIDSFSIHWHLKKMYDSAGTKIDLVEAPDLLFPQIDSLKINVGPYSNLALVNFVSRR